ncbi:MAG: EamA family transporter [Blautia sp.]|nr:EamA family transporter [Blautia sp.]MCM1200962.1 EamA family transporter [Bacteroides fragilis]
MKESFLKNRTGIILMLCSSVFACVGQLLWKLSTNGSWIEMIIGFGLYGIGALFMLIAYRYGSLSVLQPMLSMNYVISLMLGAFLLKEKITIVKFLGVIIIIMGVVMIGGGDEE